MIRVLWIFVVFSLAFKGDILTQYPFPKLHHFPEMPSDPRNPVTMEGVELGRRLFYDPILSLEKDLSCASCHKQSSAFADGGMQFSLGKNSHPTSRNSMPLFNLAWGKSFFWDGRATTIEEQIFHPVRDPKEMALPWKNAVLRLRKDPFYNTAFRKIYGKKKLDSTMVAKVIGQFLRTLISHNSKYDLAIQMKAKFTPDELAGFEIANDASMGNCFHCHPTDANALATTGDFRNNGIDVVTDPQRYKDKGKGGISGAEKEMGLFKVPSLRNLGFTAPYMHDGRFKTLEEVIKHYSTGVHPTANLDIHMANVTKGGMNFTDKQKRQLLAFLLTLNDSAFVSDKRFSSPISP